MQIPSGGGSRENFMDAIANWFKENCHIVDEKALCNKCNNKIKQFTGFVSLHDKRFSGCAGGGEVDQIPIPFCPNCEKIPGKTSSCIHE